MKALSLLTAGLLAISASALAESKTSVVLVHGAFADGSSWNKVITLLQKQHTEVIAVQLPLTSLKDDVAATQGPIKAEAFGGKVAHAAWHDKPSWYVVSKNDRMINPALERAMAKTIHAKTTEVAASHVSMVSQPQLVARTIEQAIEAK